MRTRTGYNILLVGLILTFFGLATVAGGRKTGALRQKLGNRFLLLAGILGAHIIGLQASILIQELVTLMYTLSQSALPIIFGMHIHPALSEVVERAFDSLLSPSEYYLVLEEHLRLDSQNHP